MAVTTCASKAQSLHPAEAKEAKNWQGNYEEPRPLTVHGHELVWRIRRNQGWGRKENEYSLEYTVIGTKMPQEQEV